MRVIEKGLYKHFKGNYYFVIGFALNTETNEKMVIYHRLGEEEKLYVRQYNMFASEVDKDKYPNCSQKYRFEKE